MKYAWIYSLLIHIIVPQVWRADPTLPEAHRSQALQMQSVWAEFRQVRPPRPPHEETHAKTPEKLTRFVLKSFQRSFAKLHSAPTAASTINYLLQHYV